MSGESGPLQSMMGTLEKPMRPKPQEHHQHHVESVTMRRKDPGMNAEKLNIQPPVPPAPSPTHQENLVSPFLVINHPSSKNPDKHDNTLIQSPFLVKTPPLLPKEPNFFDLEDILKESEVYPLAPRPTKPTPHDTGKNMFSTLTDPIKPIKETKPEDNLTTLLWQESPVNRPSPNTR